MTKAATGALPGRDQAGFFAGFIAHGARGHARACAILAALCLACFLPGLFTLQPMDRDEPRFAQAAKQMLETGDLVDIRFQGEARHKKPVGIYWAQSAVVAAAEAFGAADARTTIGVYRIPSLAGALAAVLLTYWAALALLPRRGALLSAALLAACLMLSAEARLAKTDALLCACAVAAMGGLARAWLNRGRPHLDLPAVLAFWLAFAVGILVKGPIVPLFAGLAAVALCLHARSARWLGALRPGLGLPVALVLVAPWFLAIAWRSGGAFFGEAVGHDMLAKVGGAAERHGAPPGSYLLAFFATFWPGAAFAGLAAPFAAANRREPAVAFLLAWVVPAWLLLEAVPTKLPHYALPLMPAVAILTVMAVTGADALFRRGTTWVAAGLMAFVPTGLAVGLAVAAWSLDRVVPFAGLAALAAASVVAVLAARAILRGDPQRGLVLGIVASAVLSPAVFGLTQPALAALKVSPRLAAIRDAMPCTPRVASLGYREPSLVFLVGTDLALPDSAPEAAAFLGRGGCRLVFVESRFADAFSQATAGTDPRRVGEVAGFNINGGRRVAIAAYAVTP